jgi:hypothetical protein
MLFEIQRCLAGEPLQWGLTQRGRSHHGVSHLFDHFMKILKPLSAILLLASVEKSAGN